MQCVPSEKDVLTMPMPLLFTDNPLNGFDQARSNLAPFDRMLHQVRVHGGGRDHLADRGGCAAGSTTGEAGSGSGLCCWVCVNVTSVTNLQRVNVRVDSLQKQSCMCFC